MKENYYKCIKSCLYKLRFYRKGKLYPFPIGFTPPESKFVFCACNEEEGNYITHSSLPVHKDYKGEYHLDCVMHIDHPLKGNVAPFTLETLDTNSIKLPGDKPPESLILNNMCQVTAFSDVFEEQIFATIDLLPDYTEGQDLLLHFVWVPLTSNTGNVVWAVDYHNIVPNSGQVHSGPTGTSSALCEAKGTINEHLVTEDLLIDGSTFKGSSQLCLRIYRDSTNPYDTFIGDAGLMRVHIKVPRWGSKTEDF